MKATIRHHSTLETIRNIPRSDVVKAAKPSSNAARTTCRHKAISQWLDYVLW